MPRPACRAGTDETAVSTLFNPDAPLWTIVVRSLITYAVIVGGMRLAGTRVLGQMGVPDFALLLLVSNAMQTAMVGDDFSVSGGFVSLATILGANAILTYASLRWRWLRHVLAGEPVVLVTDGHSVAAALAREHVTWEELDAAMREHGVDGIAEVRLAVLEIDGSISIVPFQATLAGTAHSHRRLRALRRRAS
jgi:uncharacterized membrane protein YcaP (DUF421 family)